MTQNEFQETLALIEEVKKRDHMVGAALHSLLQHLANLAGLNAPAPAQPEEGGNE